MSTTMHVRTIYIQAPFGVVQAQMELTKTNMFQEVSPGKQLAYFTHDFDVVDNRSIWKRLVQLFGRKKLHYKKESVKIQVSGSANTHEGTTEVTANVVGGSYKYEALGYDLSARRINYNKRSMRERGQLLDIKTEGNVRVSTLSDLPPSRSQRRGNKGKASNHKGPASRKGPVPSPRSKQKW